MSSNEAPSPDEAFEQTDAKIDALLRDFFRAETPAVLPPSLTSADDWDLLAPMEARSASTTSKWDFAALASLALVLVLALFALPRPQEARPLANSLPNEPSHATPAVWTPDIVGFPPSPTRIRSTSQSQRVKDGRLNFTVEDGDSLVDLKYYSTPIGTVEQRLNVEWTTVRIWEPDSGEWLQATVPAVRVDLIPLGQ